MPDQLLCHDSHLDLEPIRYDLPMGDGVHHLDWLVASVGRAHIPGDGYSTWKMEGLLLAALRGGQLTNTERITQLWRVVERDGGQHLDAAAVARMLGVREGRVRQVLGPLLTQQPGRRPLERPSCAVAAGPR
jgi:hypothetical protein